MRDFKRLKVWEKAHRLAVFAYRATTQFPKSEIYGMTSQIRRSAASIPANIAEGCGRNTGADLARFLHIAMGSASELEYHLLLARDLALMESTDYDSLAAGVTEVKRMLASYIKKLTSES
jgi:four helix bundle protein